MARLLHESERAAVVDCRAAQIPRRGRVQPQVPLQRHGAVPVPAALASNQFC